MSGEDARAATAERLAAQDWIDDPLLGFVAAEHYSLQSPAAPTQPAWSSWTPHRTIATDRREVASFLAHRTDGSELEIVPIAIVWDKTNEDRRARVYYNKTHFGSGEPRRVVVAAENAPIPADLAGYVAAMRSGDAERMRAAVDPEARIHAPGGEVAGTEFISYFDGSTGVVGGVPLQICTVTSDGSVHAVEFISWRRPPHAGLGIYRFDDGRLVEAHLYEGPSRR